MKRLLYKDLLNWKKNKMRKPLLLQGARQVGKTYLVKQFADSQYGNLILLNFEQNPKLSLIFSDDLSPFQIIKNIELYFGRKITHKNTLLFFDEIQLCPNALTSLKYFHENAPEYHIIAAGSLLGVSVEKQSSFPVGKVNFLTMYPMTFIEYLMAVKDDLLVEKLFNNNKALSEILHDKLIKLLKQYFFLGGMPEVLQTYLNTKNFLDARQVQTEIIESYQKDFSKHTTKDMAIKISQIWKSIPYQLARENKKFKYKAVDKKARSSSYEQGIEWLEQAGLIHLVYNIKKPKLPLTGYKNAAKFKIYLLDVGLLGAFLNLESKTILSPNALFTQYNGVFTENFVATDLITGHYAPLFYWTSKSDAEIDFIIQYKNQIIPIEVKSGLNRRAKSLKIYLEKHHPKYAVRSSLHNFNRNKNLYDLPLYSISLLSNFLKQ